MALDPRARARRRFALTVFGFVALRNVHYVALPRFVFCALTTVWFLSKAV